MCYNEDKQSSALSMGGEINMGNKLVKGENDLATLQPLIAAEWDAVQNNGLLSLVREGFFWSRYRVS